MKIAFKFIGLIFEADVTFEDGYGPDDPKILFETLTCEGHDAIFLGWSNLEEGLTDAAWEAVERERMRAREEMQADRAMFRQLEMI